MPFFNQRFHHIKVKKRIHKKPNKNVSPFLKIIDWLIYASVIIMPLLDLPQLLKIWISHDATGVSALSWFGFSCFAIIWMIYAVQKKEKPLFFLNVFLLVMEVIIAIGAVLYG